MLENNVYSPQEATVEMVKYFSEHGYIEKTEQSLFNRILGRIIPIGKDVRTVCNPDKIEIKIDICDTLSTSHPVADLRCCPELETRSGQRLFYKIGIKHEGQKYQEERYLHPTLNPAYIAKIIIGKLEALKEVSG